MQVALAVTSLPLELLYKNAEADRVTNAASATSPFWTLSFSVMWSCTASVAVSGNALVAVILLKSPTSF